MTGQIEMNSIGIANVIGNMDVYSVENTDVMGTIVVNCAGNARVIE